MVSQWSCREFPERIQKKKKKKKLFCLFKFLWQMLPRKVFQSNKGQPLCQFPNELPDRSNFTTPIFTGQCPYCLTPLSCTKYSICCPRGFLPLDRGLEDSSCYEKCQNLLKFTKKFIPFPLPWMLQVFHYTSEFWNNLFLHFNSCFCGALISGASYSAITCDGTLVQCLISF